METLKVKLSEWTDIDYVAFLLAKSIGLMQLDVRFQTEAKHVFWTDNPVGNTLYSMLRQLAEAEILEFREEPDLQYKWNDKFVWS
jgi:hypothetical protein